MRSVHPLYEVLIRYVFKQRRYIPKKKQSIGVMHKEFTVYKAKLPIWICISEHWICISDLMEPSTGWLKYSVKIQTIGINFIRLVKQFFYLFLCIYFLSIFLSIFSIFYLFRKCLLVQRFCIKLKFRIISKMEAKRIMVIWMWILCRSIP